MVGLGKAWSDLLAHSDAELGIDTEYTRPGTEALLDRFAESVNGVLSERGCKLFKWDGFKTPTGSSAGKKRPAAEVTAQCIFG